MPELSNKDIDDIFQRGAERYDFEFKEEAWEHMESLLERDRRRRLWWWFIGILLALLLSLTAYHLFLNHSADGPAPPREEQAPVADTEKIPRKARDSEASPEDETITTETANPPRSGAGAPPQAQRSESLPQQQAASPPAAIAESSDRADEAGQPEQPGRSTSRPNQPAPLEKLPSAIPSISAAPPRIPLHPSSVPAMADMLPSRQAAALTEKFTTLPPPKDSPLPAGSKDPKPANALTIGINFSPESASIGTDDFGKVDFKAGVSLEYRFATHFGIGTGVHYTRKHYEAGRGEYTPEKGFWTRQIAPERSFGYCSMLEVPLHFTYFLDRHDRNSLFLETGLTSFIMLNEHYWYAYDRPDPDLIRYWKSNLEYHTWLGILHISPGYQARLSPRFGVQAAPFIQIPITGVGHGNVNLYSLGLNLRVLFRMPVQR
jgi:hypothetical protein